MTEGARKQREGAGRLGLPAQEPRHAHVVGPCSSRQVRREPATGGHVRHELLDIELEHGDRSHMGTHNAPMCCHMSTLFLTAYHNGNAPTSTLAIPVMKTPRLVPKFGERLRQLRGRRSLESVALALREAGLSSFGKSTLKRYEDGRVPDVTALWALAVLYRRAPSELLSDLGAETKLDVSKLAAPGQLVADPAHEAPVQLDESESAWLELWRRLPDRERRRAPKMVQTLLEDADEVGHPPSRHGRHKSAS